MYHLLAKPVIAGIKVLHARRGRSGVSHFDAGGVVLEHGSRAHLGQAQVSEKNAETESIASGVEGSEVLGMSGACSL